MVNNVIFSHFIITKNRVIIDIIKVNKNTDKNLVTKPKYKNCGIIGILKRSRTLFPESPVDMSWVKKNNTIPFEINSHGILTIKVAHDVLKEMTKQEMTARLKQLREHRNEDAKKEQYNKCVEYLKWAQTSKAKKVVNEIKQELSEKNYVDHINQLNYRFFHHSYKVYWLREHVIKKAHQLLRLLNLQCGTDPEEIIKFCIDQKINEKIVAILLDTADRVFTNDRNKETSWITDGSRLFGNFTILEKSILSLIKFIEETQKGNGVIFGKGKALTWDEGTIIYLWKPLNMIRYNTDKDKFPDIVFEKKKK